MRPAVIVPAFVCIRIMDQSQTCQSMVFVTEPVESGRPGLLYNAVPAECPGDHMRNGHPDSSGPMQLSTPFLLCLFREPVYDLNETFRINAVLCPFLKSGIGSIPDLFSEFINRFISAFHIINCIKYQDFYEGISCSCIISGAGNSRHKVKGDKCHT